MSRGLRTATATAWALALLSGAVAAAPDSDAAERARIAADRQAVEARYEAARKDCEARFVVNRCLDQARQERRAALEPLQRQIHLLDDARRRERAVERLRVIQERQSTAAERPALAMPSAPSSAASAAAQPAPPVRRAVRPPPPASAAAAQAARQRQAQQQQRLQDAQAHQEAVQARNARQDAQRPPAAGLPVPGASAP